MSCIQVNIMVNPKIEVKAGDTGGINVSACFAPSIRVTAGVVCDVGKDAYLSVSPDYIWLMSSNNFEDNVDVLSNVVWTTSTEE